MSGTIIAWITLLRTWIRINEKVFNRFNGFNSKKHVRNELAYNKSLEAAQGQTMSNTRVYYNSTWFREFKFIKGFMAQFQMDFILLNPNKTISTFQLFQHAICTSVCSIADVGKLKCFISLHVDAVSNNMVAFKWYINWANGKPKNTHTTWK